MTTFATNEMEESEEDRLARVVALYSEGMNVSELAREYRVSRRTLHW